MQNSLGVVGRENVGSRVCKLQPTPSFVFPLLMFRSSQPSLGIQTYHDCIETNNIEHLAFGDAQQLRDPSKERCRENRRRMSR